MLSLDEIKRYSRQLVLPDFGSQQQNRLKKVKVAVTGAGGLGCPVSTYLAIAGVGRIDIIDMDCVDLTNLNRQFLYTPDDIGKPKAALAAKRLSKINANIEIRGINKKITYENAFDLLKGYDVVVDGTDNFPVRYAVNDACMVNGIPLFHGAVLMYEGRAMSIIPKETACFRCVFPNAPPTGMVPTCREAGVIGSMTGLIASIQAIEAIRYLAGLEIGLKNKMLIINADTMSFDTVNLKKRDKCSACGKVFVPKPVAEVCDTRSE
ncbi:MAG: ThiF family adenylyltransferase [Candidatus Hydrothermarchaeaceae archaeon]